MGNKIRKMPVPKYIKDFNVENRVTNEIDKMEHGMQKMAPRHPSTVEKFKQIEGKNRNALLKIEKKNTKS